MKACEFQSDNYKLHSRIHVFSRELRGVRFQVESASKGMNERLGLGKKNEERKKDNQSHLGHEAHEQGFQCSTKATRLRGQNEAMQGATHPVDKLSRAGCLPGVGG
eukprot:scaffold15581_cov85-Skeletonema_dohrnii-CCMP3373.AAC.6